MLVSCSCLPTQPVCDHFIPKDNREMREAKDLMLPNPAVFWTERLQIVFVSDHQPVWVEKYMSIRGERDAAPEAATVFDLCK